VLKHFAWCVVSSVGLVVGCGDDTATGHDARDATAEAEDSGSQTASEAGPDSDAAEGSNVTPGSDSGLLDGSSDLLVDANSPCPTDGGAGGTACTGNTECSVDDDFYSNDSDDFCWFGWEYMCLGGIWEVYYAHCDGPADWPDGGDAGDASLECDSSPSSCLAGDSGVSDAGGG